MAKPFQTRSGTFVAWLRSTGCALAMMRAQWELAAERRRTERDIRRMLNGKWRAAPDPWPPRRRDGSIDWSGMTYVEVNDTDYRIRPSTLEALLEGPMKRLFDICEDGSAIRASARVMEFARGPVARFKDRHAPTGEEARKVEDAVMAELERRFGGWGSDGRYLIDVYLGKRDHNC